MKRFLTLFAVVALVVAMAVPAFATSAVLPKLDTIQEPVENISQYFVYHLIVNNTYENKIYAYLSDVPFRDNDTEIRSGHDANVYRYALNDANGTLSWDYLDMSYSVGLNKSMYTPLYTSHDIPAYSGTGNYFVHDADFFTMPLFSQILGVTTETLEQETVPTVVGTMKVLLLCGVGLIALLVVLKLFGKRSLIYRN